MENENYFWTAFHFSNARVPSEVMPISYYLFPVLNLTRTRSRDTILKSHEIKKDQRDYGNWQCLRHFVSPVRC